MVCLISPMRYAEGLAKEPLEYDCFILSPRLQKVGGRRFSFHLKRYAEGTTTSAFCFSHALEQDTLYG